MESGNQPRGGCPVESAANTSQNGDKKYIRVVEEDWKCAS